eukprot:TRINITY_DN26777_c0_g1_i1.p1 TRINITY_DN26777_c0_g1~~TRINITY_DN26777_c0_g1_i1.p1  ORF type:complete len:147 (+),score=16.46 TRINITY_DN26777_c0_g1_i1:230-670(+)
MSHAADARKVNPSDVDTTMLSREDRNRFGGNRTPSAKPGQTMHQVGGLSPGKFLLNKALWPLYPMFGMVVLGLSLAGMNSYRELVTTPEVTLSKRRRASIPELDESDNMKAEGRLYHDSSPLRKLAHTEGGHGIRSLFFSETPHAR